MPEAPGGPPPPDPQLLATKLRAPRPREGALRRPALLARLDAALSTRLTLVSAPAGFGKTTLLAQWALLLQRPQRPLRSQRAVLPLLAQRAR